MNRAEIRSRLDEIIAFSGIERYIDTPVKRYSSGMYVRLAFAVAAHLDPEILVVDEVLSVGDFEFQKKCLGKMKQVSGSGRTILFVSHNLAAVQTLCSRVILLEQGRVIADAEPQQAISLYLQRGLVDGAIASDEELQARMEGVILKRDPIVRFREISLRNGRGQATHSFRSSEPIHVRFRFECIREAHEVVANVKIVDEEGRPILYSVGQDDRDLVSRFSLMAPGTYEAECIIAPNTLAGRTFFLSADLECVKSEHIVLDRILEFDVTFEGYNGVFSDSGATFVRMQFPWTLSRVTDSPREGSDVE